MSSVNRVETYIRVSTETSEIEGIIRFPPEGKYLFTHGNPQNEIEQTPVDYISHLLGKPIPRGL